MRKLDPSGGTGLRRVQPLITIDTWYGCVN